MINLVWLTQLQSPIIIIKYLSCVIEHNDQNSFYNSFFYVKGEIIKMNTLVASNRVEYVVGSTADRLSVVSDSVV
jgi:hypothetical protein